MQIVIEIDDNLYSQIKYLEPKANNMLDKLMRSIQNGTPLPKGHGKLIAEPTEEDITKTIGGQNDFTECIKDAVKAVFDNADTIIEANKERRKWE